MNAEIANLRARIERIRGERDSLQKRIALHEKDNQAMEEKIGDAQLAQLIIQNVAKMTQEQLEYRISELVSLALDAVFPDPYKLVLDFELKRGRSEASLSFAKGKNGDKVEPLDASGGGAVDVAAFALRVALWKLRKPTTRNVIVLDEPLKYLSRDLQPRASRMISEISKKLNLQFLIVTHEPHLLEAADKVYRVGIRDRKSFVEVEQ